MQRQGGLDNAHRMKILEEGMKFNATTVPPEDAQFLMTRQFQVEEIARLYGVPLHMLQSQSKTTSWGSGIAQMSQGFVTYTVAPWLVKWEQELDRKLLTEAEIKDGFYIKHNVGALLRGDPATRADYYTKARNAQTGWMTRNEVRALEDLNPDNEKEAPTDGNVPKFPVAR
jgi:HK97 family phage portal protein